MTIDHPLRRLLARVCSAETIARVVDPTLADIRVEDGGLTWHGCAALARALTMHAILSTPGAVVRAWNDDERALPRALAACLLTTIVVAAPLVAIPATFALRISWRALVLLLPQALAMALPASLLVAIPLAFRRTFNERRILGRGLALSAICAALTLVLMIQVLPDANQAFRVEVSKRFTQPANVPRGAIEMTLHDLREKIQILRLTPGGERVARRYEYTYQLKLAMSAISLPLGLLAIAITVAARGRWRPLLGGIAGTFGYVVVMFALDARAERLMARSATIPPTAVAWLPAAAIGMAAAAILVYTRRRRPQPACA
jgi:hypothetical protein